MISDLLQILLLSVMVVLCFRYTRQQEDKLYLIFFTLFTTALLISDLYFLVHSFLLEGVRIPFAANDIADFGTFLLLSNALNYAIGTDRRKYPVVFACAAVFAIANACLWIGWSGEWVRDILGGLSFGYFICTAIRSVYLTKALAVWERTLMWSVSFLLIAVQAATFFVPQPLETTLDIIVASVLMAAGELLLLMRIIRTLMTPGRSDAALSLSCAGFGWCSVCMYMSGDPRYTICSSFFTLSILLILLSIRKKVKAA